MIETRHLFTLSLQVPSIKDLGATPLGVRKIAQVTGGHFEGDRLRGTVHAGPGGDWLLLRNDGVLALDVRITRLVRDSRLAQIIHLVETAQASRAPVQLFVDRFARVYTPAVLALAGRTQTSSAVREAGLETLRALGGSKAVDGLAGQPVEEDDVHDDPADREQAVGRAETRRPERHPCGHADGERSEEHTSELQ